MKEIWVNKKIFKRCGLPKAFHETCSPTYPILMKDNSKDLETSRLQIWRINLNSDSPRHCVAHSQKSGTKSLLGLAFTIFVNNFDKSFLHFLPNGPFCWKPFLLHKKSFVYHMFD